MTKQWRNIREMCYIQKNNQKIRSIQIIDNIYMCVCVCVCVTIQQINISEIYVIIKNFERPKSTRTNKTKVLNFNGSKI